MKYICSKCGYTGDGPDFPHPRRIDGRDCPYVARRAPEIAAGSDKAVYDSIAANYAATHPLAAAVPQQEAGEPVMWRYRTSWVPAWINTTDTELVAWMRAQGYFEIEQIHASTTPQRQEAAQLSPPQARVPLTYIDLRRIANQCGLGANEMSAQWQVKVDGFARAIERAHLIGLETKGDGNG